MSKAMKVRTIGKRELIESCQALVQETLKVEPLAEGFAIDEGEVGKYFKKADKKRPKIDLTKLVPVGAPFSMKKLVELIDRNEWHAAAIDAISKNVVRKIEHTDPRVMDWFKNAQCGNSSAIEVLRQMVKYEQCTGNGFIVKAYSLAGEWVGMQRLAPNEAGLLENYTDTGFPYPAYYQIKNGKKKAFYPWQVIHIKEETHRSDWWGLNCLPVAVNVEFLDELKKLDYNVFRNGLLIDYIIMVQGTLDDSDDTSKQGGTDEIADMMGESFGNVRSHGTFVLETGDPSMKITVTPLREKLAADGEKELEERYRSGILGYHRVPGRLVGLQTAGQLGGDNNSDMVLFYDVKVRPLQERLAETLARHFNDEYEWGIEADDFDFGNINDIFESPDDAFFREKLRKPKRQK